MEWWSDGSILQYSITPVPQPTAKNSPPTACYIFPVPVSKQISQHRHAGRQVGAGTQHPATHLAYRRAVEMHDLAAPVHTGIGAPGTGDFHRVRGHQRQRLLHRRLHARPFGQALPTGKIGAVIFDAEGDTHELHDMGLSDAEG